MYKHHHHHHQFFGTTTIGAKGQTVIPMEARKELDLKQGDKLLVLGAKHRALIMINLEGAQKMVTTLSYRIAAIKKFINTK